jgi:hypothetical protein
MITLPDKKGLLILQGEVGSQSVLNLHGEYPAFMNCGYGGHHDPLFICNLMYNYCPPSNIEGGPVVSRFLPLAFYIHKREAADKEQFWNWYRDAVVKFFRDLDAEYGDYYAGMVTRYSIFGVTKKSTVIVLGKDTDPELQELIQVRDFLRGKGYESFLIKELPEVPTMSNEQKMRAWTLPARFCVMVDREPSGHILEYGILTTKVSVRISASQRAWFDLDDW